MQSVEVADKLRASVAQEYEVLQSSCERLRAQLMELTADVAKHEEKQRTLKVGRAARRATCTLNACLGTLRRA